MKYLKTFHLPSEEDEIKFIKDQKLTCYNSEYPFKIFSHKQLYKVDFSDITIFYGGNGSGKTTLLNLLAEKAGIRRHTDFNNSPFFSTFVKMCQMYSAPIPRESEILVSDDVFDYVLDARRVNEGIDRRRNTIMDERLEMIKFGDRQLHGLNDYDRWKDVVDAQSRKVTKSQYIRDRVDRNVDMYSNGETAMKYFTDRIDKNALYLLDEPENSLSIEYQIDLAKYIADSARFFGCQFVISTHSPVLLSIQGAKIYNLDENPVCEQKWTELPNVRRYFDFFMEHKDEF